MKQRSDVPAEFGVERDRTRDVVPQDYEHWLASVKQRIQQTQTRAAVAANRELILLYWQLGREILERQDRQGWGAKVVDRLAQDLRALFPLMKGFSLRNLKYMRAFAAAWTDSEFVQQVAAQMPWGHHQVLLDRVRDAQARAWYARECARHGWSRAVMVHQIESRLRERQGSAVTNFAVTLPSEQSELAQQLLKDPQVFDFLNLGPAHRERDLEEALVANVQRMLLELGKGFAFVGRQYRLEVGRDEFFIDLLFYLIPLHRYLAIELKVDEFKPAHVGQMQFYLTALDKQVKGPADGPSVGLILCKTRNGLVAEYALLDVRSPMGIAEYRLGLPDELASALPSTDDIVVQLTGAAREIQGYAPTVTISGASEKPEQLADLPAATAKTEPPRRSGKKISSPRSRKPAKDG